MFLSCQASSPKKEIIYSESNPAYLEGEVVFFKHCHSCHSLYGQGGNIGPSLDQLAKEKDGTMIREGIIEPERTIAPGYKSGIMPSDFGKKLKERELDNLIFYITSKKSEK